jgi:hypothetical protein
LEIPSASAQQLEILSKPMNKANKTANDLRNLFIGFLFVGTIVFLAMKFG